MKVEQEYGRRFIESWTSDPYNNKLSNMSFIYEDGGHVLAVRKTCGDLLVEEFKGCEEAERWLDETESRNKVMFNESREKDLARMKEWLQLKNLRDPELTSDFTKQRADTRRKLYGGENRIAKLVNAIYDPNDDSMTYVFLTPSTDKAHGIGYQPKKVDYEDPSYPKIDNPEHMYTIQFKFLDFAKWLLQTRPEVMQTKRITWREIKDVLESSYVQISCNCPADQYQGTNFWRSQLDGSIYPTDIAPKVWNAPDKHGDSGNFVCKHVANLIPQLPFFLNPMASMTMKVLRQARVI